jgi:glycosyltransferase involved in cell wall biosynthesis
VSFQNSLNRQRVLMFAYYFPPLGGSGVQRTLKYVKYLPSEGFGSIVVAGRPRWLSLVRDPTLSRDVPSGTVVARARTLPLQVAQGKFDGLLRRAGLPTRAARAALWPDELVGWIPAAVWHGLRAIRARRPDVIYSTSLPATCHLAALIVHRLTGLPWVADFRDAWTFDPGPESSASHPPARAVAALERTVIAEASYTTVACDSIQLLDLRTDDHRRVVILNGVDPDDLGEGATAARRPEPDRFRLSYVGSFYGEHDGSPVWTAVRDLIARGKVDPSRFEVRIVGRANVDLSKFDSLPVTLTGYVDHERAIAEMASASALLFSLPPDHPGASGKIYEYLTSGRPVLCVAAPDNRGYRLVRELGAGECADPRDPSAVVQALERMVSEWQQGTLGVDPEVRDEALRRFSRRKQAGDLAAVLGAAIAEHRTRRSVAVGSS